MPVERLLRRLYLPIDTNRPVKSWTLDGRFIPEEIMLVTHWRRVWKGPKSGLDVLETRKISCLYQGSNTGLFLLTVLKVSWLHFCSSSERNDSRHCPLFVARALPLTSSQEFSKKQFQQWALALMDTLTKGPFFVRNSAVPCRDSCIPRIPTVTLTAQILLRQIGIYSFKATTLKSISSAKEFSPSANITASLKEGAGETTRVADKMATASCDICGSHSGDAEGSSLWAVVLCNSVRINRCFEVSWCLQL